jgi:hypothetical protein
MLDRIDDVKSAWGVVHWAAPGSAEARTAEKARETSSWGAVRKGILA